MLYTISLLGFFSGTMLVKDLHAVVAYAPVKRRVPKVYFGRKTVGLLGPQTPPPSPTPTPLPDRLHLALVGKDDGSLQAKLPQINNY